MKECPTLSDQSEPTGKDSVINNTAGVARITFTVMAGWSGSEVKMFAEHDCRMKNEQNPKKTLNFFYYFLSGHTSSRIMMASGVQKPLHGLSRLKPDSEATRRCWMSLHSNTWLKTAACSRISCSGSRRY